MYVVIDVGCPECGSPPTCLGLFINKEHADRYVETHQYELAYGKLVALPVPQE